MRIVGVTTVTQCKICRSPNRARCEYWILRWTLREYDDDGQRITIPYLRDRLLELGITNPTQDNIVGHLQKHCQLLEEHEYMKLEGIALSLDEQARRLGQEFDDAGPANADTLPDRVIKIYDLQMRAELREGKVPRVTSDQVRAMIDTKTRRRQNERLTDLLDIHAAALNGAVGWNNGQNQIDAGPDEFAELVE